jgi:hypothetical protein
MKPGKDENTTIFLAFYEGDRREALASWTINKSDPVPNVSDNIFLAGTKKDASAENDVFLAGDNACLIVEHRDFMYNNGILTHVLIRGRVLKSKELAGAWERNNW